MGKKVPYTVAKEIKEIVFAEADHCNYLSKSRTENARFLNQLAGTPNVGGRLADFMQKSEVRTYIKDAILNRYAKDKIQEKKPKNLIEIVQKATGVNSADFVEVDSSRQAKLYCSTSIFVVVADGTVLKWETALRKALLYISSKPFGEDSKKEIKILLILFAHQKISPSDLNHIAKALTLCRASIYVYGEV